MDRPDLRLVLVLTILTAGCIGEIGDGPAGGRALPDEPQFFPAEVDEPTFFAQGQAIFSSQCASCHGSDGLGRGANPSLARDTDLVSLARRIHETMPLGDAGACTGTCAGAVAVYVYANVIGRNHYDQQCTACHGEDGQGRSPFPALTRIDRVDVLADVIDATMPAGNAGACVGNCADATAWYVLSRFVRQPGGGSIPGGDDPPGPVADCETPGPRMLRRLTSIQYRNTLIALFGSSDVPRQDVLPDPVVLGFQVDADEAVVRDLTGQQLMTYAEEVASWAVANRLSAIAPCRENNADCQRRIIGEFGLRAHREPLSSAMVESYRALFAAEPSFEQGLEVVLAAMIQSPFLLYRRELGVPAGGEFELTAYEIASSLSYLLTDGPPDAALMQAAAQGRLRSRDDLDREAARLLGTDAARAALAHFVDGWLDIEGVLTKVKVDAINISPEVRQSMLRESELLFSDTFYSGLGVERLFTADYTFVDRRLAEHYGVSGANGDAPQRVALNGNSRPLGILGHGAFLTAHALADLPSPVQRGYIVRERLLCQDMPPPPAGVDTNLEAPVGATSNRDRYTQHSASPQCNGCHQLMDPVGFTFEGFDAVGRRRAQDGGRPVDTSGSLGAIPEGSIPLSGLDDLSAYLAESELVDRCLTRYWSYYAYGRDTWDERGCTEGAILDDAAAAGGSLRDVLMGIVHAPHFTRRVRDE